MTEDEALKIIILDDNNQEAQRVISARIRRMRYRISKRWSERERMRRSRAIMDPLIVSMVSVDKGIIRRGINVE